MALHVPIKLKNGRISLGAGKSSKKKFCEIFFPSKNLEFLALLSDFSRFLRNFEISSAHLKMFYLSTWAYKRTRPLIRPKECWAKKFDPVRQLKNEIIRDMSSQPPVAVWPKNVPKVLKNKITEAILIVRFNSRFD